MLLAVLISAGRAQTTAAQAVASAPLRGAGDSQPHATPSAATGNGPAEIGREYPALELDATNGTLINAGRVAGHPFVLDFFATWCQPCHLALADLLEARRAATTATATLPLILVNMGEAPQVIQAWIAHAGLPADVVVTLDPGGEAARRWGARRLPTTFLVDGAGVVRHINRGWGPGYRARMIGWMRALAGRELSPKNPMSGSSPDVTPGPRPQRALELPHPPPPR